MHLTINLTQGYETIVDDIDADLAQLKWRTRISPTGSIYAGRTITVQGKEILLLMHRVILSRKLNRPLNHSEWCDHENGDGLANWRNNLRLSTRNENARNRRLNANNTSGVSGVYFDKHINKWRVRLHFNGKYYNVGVFTELQEAIAARMRAELETFGVFSPLLSRENNNV